MATGTLDLLILNKNRAKRNMTSGVFTLQMELPAGAILTNGTYEIGKIEGNIVITHVTLVTRKGFNGTLPTVTITDNSARTYFTTAVISAINVEESALTANAAVILDPLYNDADTPAVFSAVVALGGSTEGEFSLVVNYIQLDTVTGKHTR